VGATVTEALLNAKVCTTAAFGIWAACASIEENLLLCQANFCLKFARLSWSRAGDIFFTVFIRHTTFTHSNLLLYTFVVVYCFHP